MNNKFEKMKLDQKTKAERKKRFEPISINDLFSMKFSENKWIIEGLVPHEGITIISGAPASYKTWLLLQMAIDISNRSSFLNQFQCSKEKILIIDEENHLRLLRERLDLLGADRNLPIYFLSQKGFVVSDKDSVNSILEVCERNEIKIIFIDSLVRINNAEENDASQMSKVFKCIRQLCQNGKTVVLTHHERKDNFPNGSAQNRLRGSSDILASVDAHISVKKNSKNKNRIIVEQAKLRIAKELDPFEIEINENEEKVEFNYLGICANKPVKKELAKEAVDTVLQEEQNGLSIKELTKQVMKTEDIGERSIAQAVRELVKDNLITEKRGERNTKICIHSKFNQEVI